MGWTKEREELAARLWSEGSSGSEIADQLGEGLTRSAVIGKMSRMGIKSGATMSMDAKAEKRAAAIRARREAAEATRKAGEEALALELARMAPPSPPEPIHALLEPIVAPLAATGQGRRVTVLDLTARTCRWPMGDPWSDDFTFCGAAGADMNCAPPRPYCDCHAQLAYPIKKPAPLRGAPRPTYR